MKEDGGRLDCIQPLEVRLFGHPAGVIDLRDYRVYQYAKNNSYCCWFRFLLLDETGRWVEVETNVSVCQTALAALQSRMERTVKALKSVRHGKYLFVDWMEALPAPDRFLKLKEKSHLLDLHDELAELIRTAYDFGLAEEQRHYIREGKRRGATHVIDVVDPFSYEHRPVFVMPGQDPNQLEHHCNSGAVQRVSSVLDLSQYPE